MSQEKSMGPWGNPKESVGVITSKRNQASGPAPQSNANIPRSTFASLT